MHYSAIIIPIDASILGAFALGVVGTVGCLIDLVFC